MKTNHEIVSSVLKDATEQIMRALQDGGDTWEPAIDADGNPSVPDTGREVLVFLSGDRPSTAKRNQDQAWGLRLGWFDFSKNAWRVHGRVEGYVTHWREEPSPPKTASDT
jgi:hypothetical protein